MAEPEEDVSTQQEKSNDEDGGIDPQVAGTTNITAASDNGEQSTVSNEGGATADKPSIEKDEGAASEQPGVRQVEEGVTTEQPVDKQDGATAEQMVIKQELEDDGVTAEKTASTAHYGPTAEQPFIEQEVGATAEQPLIKQEDGTTAEQSVIKQEDRTTAEQPVIKQEDRTTAEQPVIKQEAGTTAEQTSEKQDEATAEKTASAAEDGAATEQTVIKQEDGANVEQPVFQQGGATPEKPASTTKIEATADKTASSTEDGATEEKPATITEDGATTEKPTIPDMPKGDREITEDTAIEKQDEVTADEPAVTREAGATSEEPTTTQEATATAEPPAVTNEDKGVAEQPAITDETGTADKQPVIAKEKGAAIEQSAIASDDKASAEEPATPNGDGATFVTPTIVDKDGENVGKPLVSHAGEVTEESGELAQKQSTTSFRELEVNYVPDQSATTGSKDVDTAADTSEPTDMAPSQTASIKTTSTKGKHDVGLWDETYVVTEKKLSPEEPPITEEVKEQISHYIKSITESAIESVRNETEQTSVAQTQEIAHSVVSTESIESEDIFPNFTAPQESFLAIEADLPGYQEDTEPKPKKVRKRKKSCVKTSSSAVLPPLTVQRPADFEPHWTRQTYQSVPPLGQLPYYPKLAFPRKWGVPRVHVEPRTVLVGFTCPPVHRFRQEQLMTHSASTLRRYYNKPCIKAIEWIKVTGKR